MLPIIVPPRLERRVGFLGLGLELGLWMRQNTALDVEILNFMQVLRMDLDCLVRIICQVQWRIASQSHRNLSLQALSRGQRLSVAGRYSQNTRNQSSVICPKSFCASLHNEFELRKIIRQVQWRTASQSRKNLSLQALSRGQRLLVASRYSQNTRNQSSVIWPESFCASLQNEFKLRKIICQVQWQTVSQLRRNPSLCRFSKWIRVGQKILQLPELVSEHKKSVFGNLDARFVFQVKK